MTLRLIRIFCMKETCESTIYKRVVKFIDIISESDRFIVLCRTELCILIVHQFDQASQLFDPFTDDIDSDQPQGALNSDHQRYVLIFFAV